ncbi:macrophage migration inhibitory factor-like [Asterias rubens]|uniref:macrophage migration inhibitory factor-like n=1 Tax=Asterias rubens TaxID=7604 RepID=UPI001454EE98|nr:macrophage migration inhibitory factor-like [Asterias rubens]
MPLIKIATNVKGDSIDQEAFLKQAGVAFQETIDKPMSKVLVQLQLDQLMSFGGTTEPCAMIDVLSAGKISKEENMKYTKALTELMAKINVPQNRMYVIFVDLPRDNIGVKNTVLSEL